MKCTVCGANLTDYESTLRHAITKQFLDTCLTCIKEIGNIPLQARHDLMSECDTEISQELLDTDEDYDLDFEDDYYKDLWDER